LLPAACFFSCLLQGKLAKAIYTGASPTARGETLLKSQQQQQQQQQQHYLTLVAPMQCRDCAEVEFPSFKLQCCDSTRYCGWRPCKRRVLFWLGGCCATVILYCTAAILQQTMLAAAAAEMLCNLLDAACSTGFACYFSWSEQKQISN
jgi:hypothetical protein